MLWRYLRAQLGCDRYQRAQHFLALSALPEYRERYALRLLSKGGTLWPCLGDQSAEERFAMLSHHYERAQRFRLAFAIRVRRASALLRSLCLCEARTLLPCQFATVCNREEKCLGACIF